MRTRAKQYRVDMSWLLPQTTTVLKKETHISSKPEMVQPQKRSQMPGEDARAPPAPDWPFLVRRCMNAPHFKTKKAIPNLAAKSGSYLSLTLKFTQLAPGTTASDVVRAISAAVADGRLDSKASAVAAFDQLPSGNVRVMFRHHEGCRQALTLTRANGLPIAGPSGRPVQPGVSVFAGSLFHPRGLPCFDGSRLRMLDARSSQEGPSLIRHLPAEMVRAPPQSLNRDLAVPTPLDGAPDRDGAATPLGRSNDEGSDDKRSDRE